MSRDVAHPALHSPPYMDNTWGKVHVHFVPEGWEDLDRGICPCGEIVKWDASQELWVVDRTFRVLVMSPDDVKILRRQLVPVQVRAQLQLQDEIEGYTKEADEA